MDFEQTVFHAVFHPQSAMGQFNFCSQVAGQNKGGWGFFGPRFFGHGAMRGRFGGFPRGFQLRKPCLHIGSTVLFTDQIPFEPIRFQIDKETSRAQFKIHGNK